MSVYTNTVPTQAYRSSGRPEMTFAVERLIDIAATKLGIDRISLRRRNFVKPKAMPYRNAVGMLYDSGRYEDSMDLAMRIADWDGFRCPQARGRQARQAAWPRACQLCRVLDRRAERAGPHYRAAGWRLSTSSSARSRPGRVIRPASRKWLPTCFACPSEAVRIIMGDTDVVKAGGGTHSGRSMRHAATVFSIAAVQMIAKGKRLAAIVLGVQPDQIDFKDGRFSTRGTNRTFDFIELAQELTKHELPDDLKAGLAVVADNEMHDPVFPNGCAICEIEVDPDTGGLKLTRYVSVDDVGRCINPLIVHGQTHGAIAQGIGQALWEQCVVDARFRTAFMRLANGLRHAALQLVAVFHNRDRRGAVADQSARHKGWR